MSSRWQKCLTGGGWLACENEREGKREKGREERARERARKRHVDFSWKGNVIIEITEGEKTCLLMNNLCYHSFSPFHLILYWNGILFELCVSAVTNRAWHQSEFDDDSLELPSYLLPLHSSCHLTDLTFRYLNVTIANREQSREYCLSKQRRKVVNTFSHSCSEMFMPLCIIMW